jgi:hypothetical protein
LYVRKKTKLAHHAHTLVYVMMDGRVSLGK